MADGRLKVGLFLFRERKRRPDNGVKPSPAPPGRPSIAKNPVLSAPAPAIDVQWESDRANSFRRFGFYFALAAIYIRFSVVHEALAVALNRNLYLLYFVMPPALLAVVGTGGIRRTLQANSARFWMAFLAWLCLATPFSAWRGGSFAEVVAYAKAEFTMLFVIAGLVMTWKECKLVMYTLALAGMSDLVISDIFVKQDIHRVDLAMGGSTISNANDLAAHLILMMALLLYLVIAPRIPTILRLVCMPMIAYGCFVIVRTGSRGAVVALGICVLFSFVMGTLKYRLALAVLVPILVLAIVPLLPRSTIERLSTLTSDTSSIDDASVRSDAEGSSEMRRELLEKSLQYTALHPLFGVGPGQFSSYEGGESTHNGQRGMWHETHNSLTQISSECGIPALIFFLCAIVSGFRLVLKTYRLASKNPANADIRAAAFILMLGIVGFMSAAFFLSLAYRFYEPALCGLCIVLYNAAQHEMAARQARGKFPPPPPWAQPQPRLSPPSILSGKPA